MRTGVIAALIALLAGLGACDGDDTGGTGAAGGGTTTSSNTTPPDPDEAVTITQGIYGEVTSGCCEGTCSYPSDEEVAVYATDPATEPTEPAIVENALTVDGFYEIALAEGDYFLCKVFENAGERELTCIPVTVSTDARVRKDYSICIASGWVE